jgi:2-polyprenyl-3-methyl-5-hydroxy-6-metoxy-1,4-benzoquinol methylase
MNFDHGTTEKHSICLICSSNELVDLKDYSNVFLCRCKQCGFKFSRKIPLKEELVACYEGYGRNDYLSHLTKKRYHELLDKFEPYRKTNRLIDVGCGIGYFLEVAMERGWEVYGTEFTQEAVQICSNKGIKMELGVLDPNKYTAESFDIITSFEVIEHINDPRDEIQRFNRVLRSGGLVYVTTPNFNSLLRYRLKSAYNVICYPEHLSYYTPKTIKKLFRSFGYEVIRVETTGISLSRLKSSKNNTNDTAISKDSTDEKLRLAFENSYWKLKIKKIINWGLTLFGVGDSLKGNFIKK